MGDYTKPISDDEVRRLSDAIETFADDVNKKIDLQTALLDRTLGKQYAVNHEPKIELPFDNEYKYVRDKLAPTFVDKGGLDKLTHIFISGYLPNGKIIKLNDTEVSNNGSSVSKYDSMYINGSKCTGNYICRVEEGGWEKLNIMVVQRQSDSINGVKGRLDIDYTDIPLENFKMLIYDDVATPLYPNVDSFIAGFQIDTLKCVGDLYWTFYKFSCLRALHLTKGIIKVAEMRLPCLQEFIAPNVSNVPNTNVMSNDKNSICRLDISNCKGTVANLSHINIESDLTLVCSGIGSNGLQAANISKIDIGKYCESIGRYGLSGSSVSEIIVGEGCSSIGGYCFSYCPNLVTITFKNANPLSFRTNETSYFADDVALTTVNLSYISNMGLYAFNQVTNIVNLTFVDDSISCQLYFQTLGSLSEQSCLNIVNAIKTDTTDSVSLSTVIREHMKNDWYCKLNGSKYITCESTDEGAMTQYAALYQKGWTIT